MQAAGRCCLRPAAPWFGFAATATATAATAAAAALAGRLADASAPPRNREWNTCKKRKAVSQAVNWNANRQHQQAKPVVSRMTACGDVRWRDSRHVEVSQTLPISSVACLPVHRVPRAVDAPKSLQHSRFMAQS